MNTSLKRWTTDKSIKKILIPSYNSMETFFIALISASSKSWDNILRCIQTSDWKTEKEQLYWFEYNLI